MFLGLQTPIAFILGRPKTTGRTGSCTACVIVPELTVLDFKKVGVLWYGCSALSGNLRNLQIVLRNLGIPRLSDNLQIGQSVDCSILICGLDAELTRNKSVF